MGSGPNDSKDPDLDPFKALRDRAIRAWRALLSAFGDFLSLLAFLPVFAYFSLYWRFKDKSRRLVRGGALFFLSGSLILFLIEVGMKLRGLDLIGSVETALPGFGQYLYGGFVLSGLVILNNNWTEAGHKRSEYQLAEALWRYFHHPEGRRGLDTPQLTLSIVHAAFARFRATRVCVWRSSASGLAIADGDWYPLANNADLMRTLPLNEGIAGLVHKDSLPRYVPRLYFPFNTPRMRIASWQFRHALIFSADVKKGAPASIDVAGKNISTNSVLFPDGVIPGSMRSFLAVPICVADGGNCQGVLSIEFAGTDPLDTGAVQMGAMLGALLAAAPRATKVS